MSVEIIQERLRSYAPQTSADEENAVKEIVQEICLAALSRGGFFKKAAFQGGTCLRIFYKMQRFSEDLDFILRRKDARFSMTPFLDAAVQELAQYGFQFEIQDRSQADNLIQKAFLKDESWGRILELRYPIRGSSRPKKIRIKIELDANPPEGSSFEEKILDFPFPFAVVLQDISSLFAGKSHALLCRKYTKGRDWYDFLWYVRHNAKLRFEFLQNALRQQGPWKGRKIHVDRDWYQAAMKEKIQTTDWSEASRDVQRFLRPNEVPSLELWNENYFLEQLRKL